MIEQIVDVKYELVNGKIVEERVYVENIIHGTLIIRNALDGKHEIPLTRIFKINVVEDEDEQQNFNAARLHTRKNDIVVELAADVLKEFDRIIGFCPETHESLMIELKTNIEAMLDMREEEDEE